MTATPLSVRLSPALYPRQAQLLHALHQAIVLSEQIPRLAADDELEAMQWACMEAWSATLTLAAIAARDAVPEALHDLL